MADIVSDIRKGEEMGRSLTPEVALMLSPASSVAFPSLAEPEEDMCMKCEIALIYRSLHGSNMADVATGYR